MNKRLMTDMADTGFFNIKKMAADFCSAQCIMQGRNKVYGIWDQRPATGVGSGIIASGSGITNGGIGISCV